MKEVVILNGKYRGQWVACHIIHKAGPMRYHIKVRGLSDQHSPQRVCLVLSPSCVGPTLFMRLLVHPSQTTHTHTYTQVCATTKYDSAVGFSDRPALDISRKHLRHYCPRKSCQHHQSSSTNNAGGDDK